MRENRGTHTHSLTDIPCRDTLTKRERLRSREIEGEGEDLSVSHIIDTTKYMNTPDIYFNSLIIAPYQMQLEIPQNR